MNLKNRDLMLAESTLKEKKDITISEEMVGHKLGEFSPTRTFSGHTPADKKAAQTAASSSSPAPAKTADKPKETENAKK